MYAISRDNVATSRATAADPHVMATFPILSDENATKGAIVDYGVKAGNSTIAIPATFVVDRNGIIRWHDVGDHIGDRVFSSDILPVLEELSQPPNTPPDISGTIPDQSVEAGQKLVVDLSAYASDEQDSLGSLQWEAKPSETEIFRIEIIGHQLTITPLPGTYGSVRIRLTLVDSGGETDSQSLLVRVIPAPNTQTEIRLTVPEGLSLIHLPVSVNSVNGAPRTIARISDLYAILGGPANVHWLITASAQTPDGPNGFKPFFEGVNDSIIEAEMGIFAAVKEPRTLHLVGTLLDAPLHLNPGWNIIGIPHYDSGIVRLSDLVESIPIMNNASQIAVLEDGKFIANAPSGIFKSTPSDRKVQTGQAILIEMTRAVTIPLPLE